ncbi:cyclase family protein [Kitasatospora kifunensis]|uniref:Kynurenine formamidase n=1 Tax=Kitasatospora kifunensis TaxID=58351 RepID=A0A7W7VT81_KITKI|nr:cyclase family protein [Kitasatospora kifunensis]MBB4922006.1 kynurenine formamidase [Kitasatospora kifunensis]
MAVTPQAVSSEAWSRRRVEELAERCRRWGQWGADDQLGALNFIDPAAVARAAALVQDGRVISCALPLDGNGPQNGSYGRTNPIHHMVQDGGDILFGAQDHLPGLRYTDDTIAMPLQCATHWDAFSHIFYDGHMYNGYGLHEVSSSGARRCGVEQTSASLTGRGVLLDIARHRGVDSLAPGEAIDGAELADCAQRQGVAVGRGDILLVRTGFLGASRARGWGDYAGGDAPGLSLDSAEFVFEREVAAVATDTWGVEVRPNQTAELFQPLHLVLLVNAGVMLGEMFDLDRLADDCAQDGRYEFLLAAAPLPFTGAVGAPMNPIAVK